jgi:hypothetical protein
MVPVGAAAKQSSTVFEPEPETTAPAAQEPQTTEPVPKAIAEVEPPKPKSKPKK